MTLLFKHTTSFLNDYITKIKFYAYSLVKKPNYRSKNLTVIFFFHRNCNLNYKRTVNLLIL